MRPARAAALASSRAAVVAQHGQEPGGEQLHGADVGRLGPRVPGGVAGRGQLAALGVVDAGQQQRVWGARRHRQPLPIPLRARRG
ncbi:MAG: hypothetical protein U0802_18040 [Candidatus Binatia bacterium]